MIWVVIGTLFFVGLLTAAIIVAGWQLLVVLACVALFAFGIYSIIRAIEYIGNRFK